MAFNGSAFTKAEFKPRTLDLVIPLLKDWFDEDEEPKFTVRGLTASESAYCLEAESHNALRDALADIMSQDDQKRLQLKEVAGVYDKDEIHPQVKIKIEMLVTACVEPTLDHPAAIVLSHNFPKQFETLIECIQKLSTVGSELVKPKPSGETHK